MNAWLIIGFAGQLFFGLRFLIQWLSSEMKGESHIPVIFWYLSLGGGATLLVYSIHIGDPVFIVGQLTGVVVYVRNLILIYSKREG